MSETMVHENFETRCQEVLRVAKDLFQRGPDWVTFFREVLGVSGAARNVFPSNEEYLNFEQSTEYQQIQQMVAALRNRKIPGASHDEPTRVITVRLPESLHEALKAEASDHKTSMNKLCISKLLQVLAENEKAAGQATSAMRPNPPAPQSGPPRPAGQSPPRSYGNPPTSGNGQPGASPSSQQAAMPQPSTPAPSAHQNRFGNRF